MARFDVYRNPNPRAAHGLNLDVQSDVVMTATRWCVPLRHASGLTLTPLATAQVLITVDEQAWLLDTPNMLAVPLAVLRRKVWRWPCERQLEVESALDFMLRGY